MPRKASLSDGRIMDFRRLLSRVWLLTRLQTLQTVLIERYQSPIMVGYILYKTV